MKWSEEGKRRERSWVGLVEGSTGEGEAAASPPPRSPSSPSAPPRPAPPGARPKPAPSPLSLAQSGLSP